MGGVVNPEHPVSFKQRRALLDNVRLAINGNKAFSCDHLLPNGIHVPWRYTFRYSSWIIGDDWPDQIPGENTAGEPDTAA